MDRIQYTFFKAYFAAHRNLNSNMDRIQWAFKAQKEIREINLNSNMDRIQSAMVIDGDTITLEFKFQYG